MPRTFAEILTAVKGLGQVTVSVAVAEDRDVLQALKAAYDAGIAKCILVGDAARIKKLAAEVGLPADVRIVDKPDMVEAALAAVELARKGEAQVVMKGLVNTSDFLRAVLNAEVGLRTGRLLSHLAAVEAPGCDRLIFHSDGGMNIAPSLAEKKDILTNAVLALHAVGIAEPNVAVLTANEQVNPKMPATVDAKALSDMAAAGEFPRCVVEGPIALDVAISPEAARHKGLTSKVSGKVDLFLMPNIETGNALGKSLIYYAKAKFAGVVLGAANPVVLASRADSPENKFYSVALACLIAAGSERR